MDLLLLCLAFSVRTSIAQNTQVELHVNYDNGMHVDIRVKTLSMANNENILMQKPNVPK